MKAILTLLLAIIVTSLSAQSKYELILGIRSGAGYSITHLQTATQEVTGENGEILATGKYIFKNKGFYVPAKAELLFGIKGFRLGYLFSYTYNNQFYSRILFRPKGDYVPINFMNTDIEIHMYTHMVRIEYNWIAKIKAAKLLFGPSIGVGGYHGIIKTDYGISRMKDIYSLRAAVMLGLNLEVVRGPFSFLFSPVYIYHNSGSKRVSTVSRSLHNIGLDVGFRVNLFALKSSKE